MTTHPDNIAGNRGAATGSHDDDQRLLWTVNQRREEALERRDQAQRDADWYAAIGAALRADLDESES